MTLTPALLAELRRLHAEDAACYVPGSVGSIQHASAKAAALIAAARNALPDLLDAAEERDRLRAALEDIVSECSICGNAGRCGEHAAARAALAGEKGEG